MTSEKCRCGARVLPRKHCERCGVLCTIDPATQVEPKPFELTPPVAGPGDGMINLPERAVYNAEDSQGRKIIILDLMSKKHTDWLRVARSVARQVARSRGTVTAEDVRVRLEDRDIFPRHHNAYGALFTPKEFLFTGDWRKSTVVRQHAHANRVWRLA